MFGLEDQKKKKQGGDFEFDLEKDLKDPKKRKTYKDRVEGKVAKIKEMLRVGEDKEDFDKFGVMLHGYTSIAKVISRFNK